MTLSFLPDSITRITHRIADNTVTFLAEFNQIVLNELSLQMIPPQGWRLIFSLKIINFNLTELKSLINLDNLILVIRFQY